MSVWRNDIKCKYMYMFPLKNLACKGLKSHTVCHKQQSSTKLSSMDASMMLSQQWHQTSTSTLVRIMACHLFSAKPLPELILTYSQQDPREHISMHFLWKCSKWNELINFSSFLPRPVLAFRYACCLRLCVSVCVCVHQSRACPCDDSSPVQSWDHQIWSRGAKHLG